MAHIDLTDGMKIGSITAYYNNGGGDATFRFEANDDLGGGLPISSTTAWTAAPATTAGPSATAPITGAPSGTSTRPINNTTHYGIYLDASSGFILYRFKIKLK